MTTRRNRKTIAAHSEGIKLLIKAKASKQNYETGKPWNNTDINTETGISTKTIGKFFRGIAIELENAFAIAQALDLDIKDIVDREEYERLTVAKSKSPDLEKLSTTIPWQEVCKSMLEQQRPVTSNFLLHDDEDAKFDREQIYVPLALVERRKPDKKESEHSPEAGSKLYEPQYEEKQRFEHQAWLEQILEKGESKTKGKRIALIGEPGAGKTTTLQDIAFWVLEKELGLPIWISLADLGKNDNLIDLQTYLFDTWLNLAALPSQQDIAQRELETQIQRERVWLLLDGVDEVATSGLQVLQYLSQQLTGWLGKSRVLLTCRLNVWQADLNFLSNFETYRLLDFDYPQQVHQFIDNRFGNKDFSKGERLKTELANPDKARLRDLIQNPLRLTLLCNSWQSNEAKLPDTKAELYAQFVQWLYKWKPNRFLISSNQQKELNKALESLAKKDINESNSQFRLRESSIIQELGYPDEKNSLFYLARRVGLLNDVGIAAESSTKEKVYAFFHPTFQEYFAACAIDDWDFFLPRDHVDKPVKGKKYRIFEPKWQEVILLWLGRKDIDEAHKKSFINKLIGFKDGCSLGKGQIIDRGFYEYQAYFLAAKGVAEFKSNQTKTIVNQIVDYVLFDCLVWSDAKDALMATNRQEAIAILTEYLEAYRSYDKRSTSHIAQILGEVSPGNRLVFETLSEIILNSDREYIRIEAINIFWKIAICNEVTIKILLHMIRESSDKYICEQAVGILSNIGKDNKLVIEFLVKIFGISFDKFNLNVYDLAKAILYNNYESDSFYTSDLIDFIKNPTNENTISTLYIEFLVCGDGHDDLTTSSLKSKPTIDSLITTIENSHPENSDYRLAIIDLGRVKQKDREKAISTLTNLCKNSSSEHIVMRIVQSLYKVDPQNELILETVPDLIKNASHSNIIEYSIACLDKFDKINNKIIDALVIVIQTSDDEEIIYRAAEALGNINSGNKIAIAKLINLIEIDHYKYKTAIKLVEKIKNRQDRIRTSEDISQYYESKILFASEILYSIDSANKIAHDNLIGLIQNSSDEYTRDKALNILIEIVDDELIERIIVTFQKYLIPEKYEVEFQIKQYIDGRGILSRPPHDPLYNICHTNCWHFEDYYELMWFCSNNVSYDRFYQAWNKNKLSLWLNTVWQKVLLKLKIHTRL